MVFLLWEHVNRWQIYRQQCRQVLFPVSLPLMTAFIQCAKCAETSYRFKRNRLARISPASAGQNSEEVPCHKDIFCFSSIVSGGKYWLSNTAIGCSDRLSSCTGRQSAHRLAVLGTVLSPNCAAQILEHCGSTVQQRSLGVKQQCHSPLVGQLIFLSRML